MYKYIHLLKAGIAQLSNHELACIESWKKVYPDFEIKVWTDEEIRECAEDCIYASDNYNKGRYAYVIDYTRLKFLYEYGGLYMDTDVMAINRVPDEYFEHSFISMDDKFDSHWTNNGCVTYVKKGDPLVKEFIDKYNSLEYDPNNPWHNNWPIDLVLKEHNFNFESDIIYGSLTDRICEDMMVLNRIQFGGNDYMLNRVVSDPNRPIYFQHCHALSWMGPYVSQTQLYYAILDDETDQQLISDKVDEWIETEPLQGVISTLVIYVNTLNGFDTRLSQRLLSVAPRNWESGNKFWFIQPIGTNLTKAQARAAVLDFMLRRFSNIKMCRDIMK